MSHTAFQESLGTPFHLSWNGEDVMIGAEDAEATTAVVDLDQPISGNDRGEGVVGRGKLIFTTSDAVAFGEPIWIRGDRWEYDRERKPEDGNKIIFVVRREPNFTTSRLGGYQGGH